MSRTGVPDILKGAAFRLVGLPVAQSDDLLSRMGVPDVLKGVAFRLKALTIA